MVEEIKPMKYPHVENFWKRRCINFFIEKGKLYLRLEAAKKVIATADRLNEELKSINKTLENSKSDWIKSSKEWESLYHGRKQAIAEARAEAGWWTRLFCITVVALVIVIAWLVAILAS